MRDMDLTQDSPRRGRGSFERGSRGRRRGPRPAGPAGMLGGPLAVDGGDERGPRGGGRPGRGRFGPGGPEGFGPHGPGGHGPGGGRRGGGRGRAGRGQVRAAVLHLLAEEPMHGYQLMQAIGERTNGAWTPSPGAIYPTLSQLQDEGLVELSEESGRKLASLTDAGREHVAANPSDPFAGQQGEEGPDLRRLMEQVGGAVRLVARTGTDAQREQAATVLADARRRLHLVLAEEGEGQAPAETE